MNNLNTHTYYAVRYLSDDNSRYYLVTRELGCTQGAEEGYFWQRKVWAEKAAKRLENRGVLSDIIKVTTNKKLKDESDHYKLVMCNKWMLENN